MTKKRNQRREKQYTLIYPDGRTRQADFPELPSQLWWEDENPGYEAVCNHCGETVRFYMRTRDVTGYECGCR